MDYTCCIHLFVTVVSITESSSAEDGDEEEERGDDNDSDDGFNLMKHIESLLPGDYVDGKPTKAANKQHLEDLRPSKKKWKKINYRRYLGNAVKNHMEKQREKRKHHILREYEEKIKKYYLAEQERITKELEEQQKAVLLEAYRTHERIKKNSIKVSYCL